LKRLLKGLLLKPTLNLLEWILRRNGNSLILGGPLGWSWQSTLDATHHGALAGPANAHRHSDLANIGIDDHHARDHAARHQDGGSDEISIAGLSGEPAELTTHKGATTGIHGVGASTVESAAGAQSKVDAHANLTTAHSAVSTATASRMVVRDASARAKFAAPGAAGDALIKGARITVAELPALTNNKIWKGTGADPTEIDVPGAVIAGYEERVASETLRNSNDTQRQTGNTSWTKIKEIKINAFTGTIESIKVKFDSHAYDNYCDNYFRIYKNGSPIGAIWHRESATWYTSSEDFGGGWVQDDLIQIYAYSQRGASDPAQAKNMRLYYDWNGSPTITHISSRELVTALPIVQTTADATVSTTNQDP